MKIHVLDGDKLSRRVLDQTWPIWDPKKAENDPNLAPKTAPNRPKIFPKTNACQAFSENKILIDNKTNFMRRLGRSGGMRWPPGGIIGGSKNYTAGLKDFHFEDWQVSLAYYA